MPEKYLFHVPKEDHLVGLLHLRKNLFALLMEAKYLNRIAIIPSLHLNGKHNSGLSVRTTWDKFIILDNFQSFNPFIRLSDFGDIDYNNSCIIDENIKSELLLNESNPILVRKHTQYPNYYKLLDNFINYNWDSVLTNLIQSTDEITQHAKIAISKMKYYHCIHVRRGDKLMMKNAPGLDKKTHPDYLKRFLLNIISNGETVYIMSDEKQPNYFDSLRKSFNIYSFLDFPEFVSIEKTNNYLLFSIENEIMNNAITKIRTFKEDGYISILNYSSGGAEFILSKLKRRLRKVSRLFFR